MRAAACVLCHAQAVATQSAQAWTNEAADFLLDIGLKLSYFEAADSAQAANCDKYSKNSASIRDNDPHGFCCMISSNIRLKMSDIAT
ncbi:hypothetical protein [Silvibacterium sp.]|uniref:hypothetical protein n=1 Tax=Silvibacterium sp. TaxID=1964179 RepID=UPI0039E5393F